PDDPGGGRVRAAHRRRVPDGGPDPRQGRLLELRRHHVQQHRGELVMSLTFHWFLPTSGDGRAIIGRGHSIPMAGGAVLANTGPPSAAGQPTGARAVSRPPDLDYLGQIARSAEQLGFTG